MCGIAGIKNFNGKPVKPDEIVLMADLMRHRGPDDHGYAFFNSSGKCFSEGRDIPASQNHAVMALGHRRLTIIDLQETGRQPMSSQQQRFWITFNGEIYNYIELREQLKSLGHTFTSTGDTEVILKAYQQWSTSCIERFNGMWAFAIWDCQEQELFCSRDRMGVKPFYYYFGPDKFIFASEVKAVVAALEPRKRNTNTPYIARFIINGLLNDGNDTFFEHVQQLRPAHCLLIKNNQMTTWRYWDIPQQAVMQADTATMDQNQAVEQFRDLLTDSIRLRFRADVPVGMCLSGGLDSSSVVALASKALSAKLLTFTTEYQEKDFSEGRYAREVVRCFGTEAKYTTPTGAQFIDFIDKFSWYHDEPCPGPGPFSQWHVMQLASKDVKVVLDGQGADEVVAGYYHYFNYYLTSVFKRMFNTGPARTTLKQYLSDNRLITRHLGQSQYQGYLTALSHIANRTLPAWLRDIARPLRKSAKRLRGAGAMFDVANKDFLSQSLPLFRPWHQRYRDDLNDILYRELTRDNIPMLLQFNDRTSMAFSIESRVPFLDYRLVEFCGSLPYNMKIQGNVTKKIMRQAMRGILPDMVVDRPDKKGYPTPFALWLKGPINQYVKDMITSKTFTQRNIFQPDKVQTLLQQHCTGQADHAWLLWRIVNTERWMQAYTDNFPQQCQQMTNSTKNTP